MDQHPAGVDCSTIDKEFELEPEAGAASARFPISHSQLKPRLDAIFDEIQRNLPSIDDSIDEEDLLDSVEIFQHPIRGGLLSDDDEKDLDESLSYFDADGSGDQGKEHFNTSVQENTKTAVEPASPPFPKQSPSYLGEQEDNAERRSEIHLPLPPITVRTNGESELDIAQGAIYSSRASQTHALRHLSEHTRVQDRSNFGVAQEPPKVKLSMNGLERIDLDLLLQRVVETEYRTRSRKISVGLDDVIMEASLPSSDDEMNQRQPAPAQVSASNVMLMEKLAAFCESQCGTPLHVDPRTGATVQRKPSTHRSRSNAAASTDFQTESSKVSVAPNAAVDSGASIVQKSKNDEEKQTVFLDLRKAESIGMSDAAKEEMLQGVARRVLKVHSSSAAAAATSSSDSSSSDEDDTDRSSSYARDAWFEQRRIIRESFSKGSTQISLTRHTAHNHTMNSGATDHDKRWAVPAENIRKVDKYVSQKQPQSHHKQNEKLPNLQKQCQTLQNSSQEAGHHLAPCENAAEQMKLQPSVSLTHSTAQDVCSSSAGFRPSGTDLLAAEKISQSRARLKSNLDALRPKRSTSGKQECAGATPVVFDSAGSYSRPVGSLLAAPAAFGESILLTVYLASNGEILEHRNSAVRPIDSVNGWPASYLVLLSWLGSLVPNSNGGFKTRGDAANTHGCPFDVVGIQQMWLNERLLLAIAIIPAGDCQEKLYTTAKKSKKKDGDQATQFQQIVSKFLVTHSLKDVTPWLQNCEPQPIVSTAAAPEAHSTVGSYTYYAPAPVASSRMLSTFIHMNPDPEGVRKVFGTRIGFFWQTVDDHREMHDDDWSAIDPGQGIKEDLTHVTVVLIKQPVYRKAEALFAVLARTLQQGLDVAGVRLAIAAQTSAAANGFGALDKARNLAGTQAADHPPTSLPDDVTYGHPVLALALRGTFARPVWLEELGPADPLLARRTDPNSLMALYGGDDRSAANLCTPRNEYRVAEELATYFGGRVPESGVINVGTDAKAGKFSSMDEDDLVLSDESGSSIAHLLTATVASDVLLIISSLLPVRCYGIVISACQRRGYAVRGLRRRRLTVKQAAGLGIAGELVGYFSTLPTAGDEAVMQAHAGSFGASVRHGDGRDAEAWSSRPAAILHLRKENAAHHVVSLIECFMVQLTLQGLLDGVCQIVKTGKLCSSHLFHIIPYTKHVLQTYAGGEFTKVPDLDSPAAPGYIAPRLHNNPELEQVVILALLGHEQATTFGLLLADILGTPPCQRNLPKGSASAEAGSGGGTLACLELLGMKWLPKLSIGQAKELTPCEPGDREWKSSLQKLTAGPAIVLCLRGVRPHEFLRRFIEPKADSSLFKKQEKYEKILSPTLEMAFRLASIFFFDYELLPDDESRPLKMYLPPYRSRPTVTHDGSSHQGSRSVANCSGAQKDTKLQAARGLLEECILKGMLLGPRPLATLLVVKPSVARRSNLARLFRTLFHEGFRLAGLSLRVCTEAEASQILPSSLRSTVAASSQPVDAKLEEEHRQLVTSEVSYIVCLLRENAIKRLLDILGPEDPADAKKLDPFLWRGCYGSNLVNNGFYGSTNYATSVNDIKTFFPGGLCCLPTMDLECEEIKTACQDSSVIVNKRTVLVSPTNSTVSGHHETPAADLLLEVNCLLLMPSALAADSKHHSGSSSRAQPLLADMLECLQTMSFSIVGAKLVLLSDEQACSYLCLVNAGSFRLVPELTAAPCLAIAVQRDNAVTTFPYLLQSGFAKANLEPSAYESHIIYPKDIETAKKLLGFFFETLTTASKWKICEKDS